MFTGNHIKSEESGNRISKLILSETTVGIFGIALMILMFFFACTEAASNGYVGPGRRGNAARNSQVVRTATPQPVKIYSDEPKLEIENTSLAKNVGTYAKK